MAKRKTDSQDEIKTSAFNLLLNAVIFLLGAVIIYLLYSAVAKIGGGEEPVEKVNLGTPSEIIQVEVLNGCGVSGVADRFTDYLRRNKVDVVNVGNYHRYDVEYTLVIDRMGNRANAYKVAQNLGIKNKYIVQQLNDDYFLDVTVVVGRDYYKLSPMKTGD